MAEIERLRPDLVILDYMWAEEDNGWSLLQMLQMNPKTEKLPIIVCTGAIRKVEALSGHLEQVGVRVIIKPFNINELLEVITELLAAEPEAKPATSKPTQPQR